MKRRARQSKKPQEPSRLRAPEVARAGKIAKLGLGVIILTAIGTSVWVIRLPSRKPSVAEAAAQMQPRAAAQAPQPPSHLTFCKDIAPIIYQNCANCHRPGQVGPFNLLIYEDVRKRAPQIAEVTRKRFMPPWPPEPGLNHFIGERVLRPEQVRAFQDWLAQGTPEGNPTDLPPLPSWPEGWTLGTPDLVVEMPQPYLLPAEGRDVYRNFVIPLPLATPRYFKAVDLQPGSKAVHHAFVLFDSTSQSRRLDAESPEPGFGGMGQPGNAQSPGDTFLSWQPGKTPRVADSSWKLQHGMDLVLQMHMQTTGKPEQVRPQVAFYFTEHPSTNLCFKIGLDSFSIDIPPGEQNYLVEDAYKLPVDVELTAIYPHAHYLGKELSSFAILPDGTRKPLLLIKDWDFNWQGDYRYAEPLVLPKGSVIQMHFTYDNSTNNIRNPSHPPRRVQYGVQTSDEMANLSFLLRVRTQKELDTLAGDYQFKAVRSIIAYCHYALAKNPNDAHAEAQMGKSLLALERHKEAELHLRRAIELNPRLDDAYYHLGVLLEDQQKSSAARIEYEKAVQLNPDRLEAQNNLGLLYLNMGDVVRASEHLRAAARLAPDDPVIQENLQLLEKSRKR